MLRSGRPNHLSHFEADAWIWKRFVGDLDSLIP